MTSANPLDIQPDLVVDLLVRFLHEEIGQSGFDRALVGLSGGLDSAVVAALCARAFGAKHVLAVTMPYRTSNPESEAHAKLVADHLGVATRRVDITRMADGYLDQERVETPLRRGNVMARCRMIALYDLSVEWRGLVVGTSNKTEILLGYTTQWGDGAHAVNPLGDLYKHQVYQVARHLGLPRAVLDKAPSADLFAGQTDEAELGFTYAAADAILFHLIDERYSEEDLVALGHSRELIRKIVDRVVRYQFKRLPPLIAKLSLRTVNRDFRYLRDWEHSR